MRKLMFLVAVVAFVAMVVPVQANAQVRYFKNVVVGNFEFPWLPGSYDNEMVVWSADDDSIMVSSFSGQITGTTKVRIFNRNLGRENLDLLTGERVFAVGLFHMVGEGEGSTTHCDSLTVYLLSRENPWGEEKFSEASVGWARVRRDLGSMSVWPTEERTGGTYFAGELTAYTTVRVHERNVKRADIDLLDGEYVACLANFRNVGHGEGSQRFYVSLDIWVLPRLQY